MGNAIMEGCCTCNTTVDKENQFEITKNAKQTKEFMNINHDSVEDDHSYSIAKDTDITKDTTSRNMTKSFFKSPNITDSLMSSTKDSTMSPENKYT